MAVQSFNHFNIRAPRPLLEAVRYFYVEVIGLEVGARPATSTYGYWLYLGDLPVLHLMEWTEPPTQPPSERTYLDHVAFSCSGVERFINKLDALGVDFKRRDFSFQGAEVTQLNLTDPVGTGVELNFSRAA
ncbi:MAG: hypothetical protein P8M73_00705 [Luminiphilus sp.]|nr:hypothetical protein [Luminiphilus sp.]